MSVFGVQNSFKFPFCLGLFPAHLFIDFGIDMSMFGTSKSWFSHGRYCKKRLVMEIVFSEFRDGFSSFLEASGNVFLIYLALKTDLKTEGFL